MFETFESRVLMANTISPVTAKLSRSGTLFITGTDAAEKTQIIQTDGGGFYVRVGNTIPTLVGTYGLTSRIQQSRYKPLFDLGLVKRISVSAAGGNDEVLIGSEKGVPVVIHGGEGDDTISSGGTRSSFFGDAGNDAINVASQSLTYTNPTFQRVTEAGNNIVTTYDGIANARSILNATGNHIEGGDGDDIIYTRGTEDSVYGGAGDDQVVKMNDLDTYTSDLPALPVSSGSNSAPSRLAAFGVEAIVAETSARVIDLRTIHLQGAIEAPVVVRRNTIDALIA